MNIENAFGFFVTEIAENGEKREIKVLNRNGEVFRTAGAAASGANALVKDWDERFEAIPGKANALGGKMYKNTTGLEKSILWIEWPVLIQEFYIYEPV